MKLMYVRHAVAMERDEFARYCIENGIEPDDELRPLTAEGKKKMKRAAHGLVTALVKFNAVEAGAQAIRPIIVTSPLVRAKQTATILTHAFEKESKDEKKDFRRLKPAVVTTALSPGTDPEIFRDFLYAMTHAGASHRPHPNTLVIAIGHEPHLSASLGWWLAGEAKSRFPLKKGGATLIEVGGALSAGEARLIWALPPWALREISHAHSKHEKAKSEKAKNKPNKKTKAKGKKKSK